MRARLPLDAAAVLAANESVRARTTPPGRPLDPADPADRKLRREWMEAYAAAGGEMEAVPAAPPQSAVPNPSAVAGPAAPKSSAPPRVAAPEGQAIKRCKHNNFIELRYLDYRGGPVAGAGFEITSRAYSTSGTLDGNGFVHLDGVPEISGFDYEFFADPKPYRPSKPATPAKGEPQQEAAGMLRRLGGWVWGTVQGDWNEDATIGQIGVNAGLGLIPLVDQALDLRDLTANIWWLIDWYMKTPAEQAVYPVVLELDRETWLWFNTFICAIGCIPEFGSAVKGVLKGLLKELTDTFRRSGGISPEQARHIWEMLISYANHVGIEPGNAARWLKELPAQAGNFLARAAVYIERGFQSVEAVIARAEAWARRLPGGAAARVLDRAQRVREALIKARRAMSDAQKRVNDWIRKMFSRILPGENRFRKTGNINVPAESGANTRIQDETPPPTDGPVEPPHAVKPKPTDLGLGLDNSERGLNYRDWAKKNGWDTYGAFDTPKGNFPAQVDKAMSDAERIHFNLDGVDPSRASPRLKDTGEPVGYTNYELYLLKTNPSYSAKTTWYKDGVAMPPGWSPF